MDEIIIIKRSSKHYGKICRLGDEVPYTEGNITVYISDDNTIDYFKAEDFILKSEFDKALIFIRDNYGMGV